MKYNSDNLRGRIKAAQEFADKEGLYGYDNESIDTVVQNINTNPSTMRRKIRDNFRLDDEAGELFKKQEEERIKNRNASIRARYSAKRQAEREKESSN